MQIFIPLYDIYLLLLVTESSIYICLGLFCPIELSGRNDRHNDMDRVDVCFGNNDGCSICSGNDKGFLKVFISKIFVFPIELIPKVRRHPSRKQFFPFCRFAVSDSDNWNYSSYNGQKLFGFFSYSMLKAKVTKLISRENFLILFWEGNRKK